MRKARRTIGKTIAIVSLLFLVVSLVLLAVAWMIPETEAGRAAEKILAMRVLPQWLTGPDFTFTGRHWTFVGIGWKAVLVFGLITPLILRKLRQ